MLSDTDLPHQPDILQQQSPLKKKSNPNWKVIFITLLIINITSFLWTGNDLSAGGVSGVVIAFFLFVPLTIIDLIAVLSYVFTHRPLGKVANGISTLVFFILSFFGITAVWIEASFRLGIDATRDTRFETFMIAIVIALLSLFLSRYISHK
jgi:hypothetical protein